MARRKDHLPPFEIMGSAPPRRPWHEREREGKDEEEDQARDSTAAGPVRSDGVPPGQWLQWLSHAGPPLVLRVPRGLAISVVLGVLGLLVVAYWVGFERGEAAMGGDEPPPAAVSRGDRVPIVGAPSGGSTQGRGASSEPDGAGGDAVPEVGEAASDPRVPGLNYMVMARRNRRGAIRLAQFIREQGVETILVPDSNEMYLIVATERGFDEMSSDEYQAYRNRLRAIGRAWKRHNDGRGSALEDMYLALYKG